MAKRSVEGDLFMKYLDTVPTASDWAMATPREQIDARQAHADRIAATLAEAAQGEAEL